MSKIPGIRAIEWIARIWSLASLGFVLLFVFGQLLNGNGARPTQADGLAWDSFRAVFVLAS